MQGRKYFELQYQVEQIAALGKRALDLSLCPNIIGPRTIGHRGQIGGKITVYGIPEIVLWKFRNQFLIYQEWYNEKSEMISDTSVMRAVPKPHQPPHLAYFDMLIFLYQNEN